MRRIGSKLNRSPSEISNFLKYTTLEMFLHGKGFKTIEDELFELRAFRQKAIRANKNLRFKLSECEKSWWQRFLDRLEDLR